MRLIAYATDVSSIIDAGLELSEDAVYTHKFSDSIEAILRTGMIRSVLIVSRTRDPILEKTIDRYNIPYRYRRTTTKWYEEFVSRHLIEPRIRDFKNRLDGDYPGVLRMEYKTLRILNTLANNRVPRKYGDFLYLHSRKRFPTLDLAVALHVMYGGHVCVSSHRDTGLAFACITSPATARELYRVFRQITPVVKTVMGTAVTGFIVSFPESPRVVQQDIISVLEELEATGTPSMPRGISRRFPFLEMILDSPGRIRYERFGRIKARLYADRIPVIEDGRHYMLLSKTNNPAYTYIESNGATLYKIHVPVSHGVAVYTSTENPKIIVCTRDANVERTDEAPGGYIHYLPRWVVPVINKYVRKTMPGIILVREAVS